MRAKISIVFLSVLVLVSFGFSSNQAFAGLIFELPGSCQDCADLEQLFIDECSVNDVTAEFISPFCESLFDVLQTCRPAFCAVGGTFEGVDTTSLVVVGAQMNASWMIPVIVSAIGIGIVIARKF